MSNIRDMTEGELQSVCDRGACPNCGHTEWYAGPRGGMAQNHKCVNCGLGINVVEGMRCGQIISEPSGYEPPQQIIKSTQWQSFLSFMSAFFTR